MIITIARQCGCNAIKIGELLSERYNLPLYTRKTLMEQAEEMGTLQNMKDFFDEDPVDDLMNAITSFTEELTEIRGRFLRSFNNIIRDKDCIIIGRCGNHIFHDRKDLVSVFLHGNENIRTRNIAQEKKITLEEARDYVTEIDERRESYHKFYTGLTWGNSADYDISLDCCRLGIIQTAKIIEEYITNTL